jgi:hypothetical protein
MRLIPRRKRIWLLALLSVALVGLASIWWATSEKSDFEKLYDEIKVGMTVSEAGWLLQNDSLEIIDEGNGSATSPSPESHFGWMRDGERIIAEFKYDRLTEKEFKPLPIVERLRRLWRRMFKSNPPF